jgi:hypothetical protein
MFEVCDVLMNVELVSRPGLKGDIRVELGSPAILRHSKLEDIELRMIEQACHCHIPRFAKLCRDLPFRHRLRCRHCR